MTARWNVGDFALVPFGTKGADQVALVVRAPERGAVVVRKWTSHKRRFLKADTLPVERLLRRPRKDDERLLAATQALGDLRATVLERLGQRALSRAQSNAIASCYFGVCPLCYALQVPIIRGTGSPAAGFEHLHAC